MQSTPARSILSWALPLVAVLLTTLPARVGAPDPQWRAELHWRQYEARVAQARLQAQAAHLATRYRRPHDEVLRHVRAAWQAGEAHGLPATLLLAMAETESSMNPAARSRYGALGLLQVVPRYHPLLVREFGGKTQLLDGETSIAVGARILADYLARSGDLDRALARYSGGSRRYAERIRGRMAALDEITDLAARQVSAPIAATAMDMYAYQQLP